MRLREQLESYTVTYLRELAEVCLQVCGGPGPEGKRKEHLVDYLCERLTAPGSPAKVWERLDPLSKKAVASAYHAGGELDEQAFAAQYGEVPGRRGAAYFDSFDFGRRIEVIYGYAREPAPLDLLLHYDELPWELMPLLETLVPPPEKFRLESFSFQKAPGTVEVDGERLPLVETETAEAGLHDLLAYLRLYEQDELRHSTASMRLTPTSVRKLLDNLLEGDFLSPGENFKPKDAIRPFGLDAFARGSGLLPGHRGPKLSDSGEALLWHRDLDALLEAFENWTGEGSADELDRLPAIKGKNAKRTLLTPPAWRREAIVEGLSWCPVGAWIPVEEFYRALTVWQLDFELDRGYESQLSIEDPLYGRLYYVEAEGRALIKNLYTNAVLMEILASIGALDLLYLPREEGEGTGTAGLQSTPYSPYDRLHYFRINPLGAYLFGQAGNYTPAKPFDTPLFEIDGELTLALGSLDELTPNLRHRIEQLAVEEEEPGRYRLDTRRVLDTLESGGELEHISEFLQRRHEGPLPKQVTEWLEEIEDHSHTFHHTGNALYIKARSQTLARTATGDPVLGKFVKELDSRTLLVPANKEKAFRRRLKEMGYLPPG